MDHEKYPNYFLAVLMLYAIVLLIGLAYFILPSISFAAGYADFYMLTVIFVLPMILFVIYELSGNEFLRRKEKLLRLIITALVILDFLFDVYLVILLI